MSHIVYVYSSPLERGNTNVIGKAVCNGAMYCSTNTFSMHDLSSMHPTNFCTLCSKCKKTGHCSIDDPITNALEEIKNCDALIIALPLFFGHPSAQYMALENRMWSFISKRGEIITEFPDKPKKIVIILSHDGDEAHAYEFAQDLSRVYSKFFNIKTVHSLIYDCYNTPDTSIDPNDPILEEAFNIGKSL